MDILKAMINPNLRIQEDCFVITFTDKNPDFGHDPSYIHAYFSPKVRFQLCLSGEEGSDDVGGIADGIIAKIEELMTDEQKAQYKDQLNVLKQASAQKAVLEPTI